MEAFTELGITKLTTRISELRRDGYNIVGEQIVYKKNGKRISWHNRYRIEN